MEEIIKFFTNPTTWLVIFISSYIAIFIAYYQEKDKSEKPKWFKFAIYLTLVIISIVTYHVNLILFTFLTTLFIAFFIVYEFIISRYKKKGFYKPMYNEIKFKRFEKIEELKFSLLEYSPFGYYNPTNGDVQGIGLAVLNKIFEYKRPAFLPVSNINWSNALDKLEDKSIDIILTPLFETRSRLTRNVEFCSPLFYSNIGIYVHKDINTQTLENTMNFVEAINFLKTKVKNSEWKAKYIIGELSEFLIEKHNLNGKIIEKQEITNQIFKEIIDDISSDKANSADFTFMEVFKVESFIKEGANVVNILKENQLLYPVSFAIRKEHTVLKNYINLRLMELRSKKVKNSTKVDGSTRNELEKLIMDYSLSETGITTDKFDKIFIQEFDFKSLY